MDIDDLDVEVLQALIAEGRVKWSTLAARLGLSPPAIADRVKRLEKAGFITGYTVQLDAAQLGFNLTAFVSVTLARPEHRQAFLDYVQANDLIQTCHHIIGEADYLLQVMCRSTTELEQLLSEELKALPGIIQTRTTIALSAVKLGGRLPISAEHAAAKRAEK